MTTDTLFAIATYIVKENATVRTAAKAFGCGKSSVHRNMSRVLPKYSVTLAKEVREVLDKNKKECTIRGGYATATKYRMRRQVA